MTTIKDAMAAVEIIGQLSLWKLSRALTTNEFVNKAIRFLPSREVGKQKETPAI